MIKVLLSNGAIVVGLPQNTCAKLLAGKVIEFNTKECGGADQVIIICGGATDDDIVQKLKRVYEMTPTTKVSQLEGDGFAPSTGH